MVINSRLDNAFPINNNDDDDDDNIVDQVDGFVLQIAATVPTPLTRLIEVDRLSS